MSYRSFTLREGTRQLDSIVRTFSDRVETPSSILIEDIQPRIDCGRYPVKREVGDSLEVTADIFREGHDQLAAVILYKAQDAETWSEADMAFVDNDRWSGVFPLDRNTRYHYTVQAFPDVYGSWVYEIQKKTGADLEVGSEIIEGLQIVEETLSRAGPEDAAVIREAISGARDTDDQTVAVQHLTGDELAAAVHRNRSREGAAQHEPALDVVVDRVAARFAAWYSMFPRSAGTVPNTSATFRDVEAQLPRIAGMGFDVLYFTPIHPIGATNRKGKNNTLNALPDDPGVPYGIGSLGGGHDAIEPTLGTIDDFRRLVDRAADHGIEIALDIALQASPDHPWAKDHPEWFYIRPDGSIKYAENPPKKYQDIYPINFANEDWKNLWLEIRRIIRFWVDHGVKTFRVDNPHTKPTLFWEWLIAEIQRDHPDVIFLSEAFTRPKVMKALAKAGFTQSYTYFTWRNFKQELMEYGTELTQTEMKEYLRGNFFTNTHDILPYILQEGRRPAFQFRIVLAATMSSVYGIYSGFELCEATSVPGREEYLNSEKYEFKVWDWDREGNISEYIARINAIRREHPALQEYDNLRFHDASDDNVLCYSKVSGDGGDIVVMIVNLDPFHAHESDIRLPIDQYRIEPDGQYRAQELLTGETFLWSGPEQRVRLDPATNPAMILHIRPWIHKDYAEPCS